MNVAKKQPAYQRIETWLLRAFKGVPQIEVPAKGPRIFEMRTYESHSEEFGNRKVEMFNSGEIAVFRDCGVKPVFFGQTIAGGLMPNLTYMVTFKDQDAQNKGWAAFRTHPGWEKLKNIEKYKGAVSNITKRLLKPKSYSQI